MAEVKIGTRFQKSLSGSDRSETFKIIFADVLSDRVTVEVEKEINDELWVTKRNLRFRDVQTDFHNNHYEYIQ